VAELRRQGTAAQKKRANAKTKGKSR